MPSAFAPAKRQEKPGTDIDWLSIRENYRRRFEETIAGMADDCSLMEIHARMAITDDELWLLISSKLGLENQSDSWSGLAALSEAELQQQALMRFQWHKQQLSTLQQHEARDGH